MNRHAEIGVSQLLQVQLCQCGDKPADLMLRAALLLRWPPKVGIQFGYQRLSIGEGPGMNEHRSEEQRQEILRLIKEAQPDRDMSNVIAGSLAGPASPDRPPVPVWKYLAYKDEQQELTLTQIEQYRFPIILHGGETMITSLAEMTEPAGPPTATPTYIVDTVDAIRLYELMHIRGALGWNADTLSHEELLAPSDYRESVYEEWRKGLRPWTEH